MVRHGALLRRDLSAASPKAAVAPGAPDETPLPSQNDRDRDRILRLQGALHDIVHGGSMDRLKIGLSVVEARTGRVFFGRSSGDLMDPASNQKVLATTTALVRLGSDWRFRTEVYGPAPDGAGVIHGNLFLRGSGDPTLGTLELEDLAQKLLARGVTRVDGGVVADPRRIGDDWAAPEREEQPPLMTDRGLVSIRVRAGAVGAPPQVILDPAPPPDATGAPTDVFISNLARTAAARSRDARRGRLTVRVTASSGMLQVTVAGRIAAGSPGIVFRRRVPQMALATGVFFRAALIRAGIVVRDRSASGTQPPRSALLAAHYSSPLGVLLRKINKDSDNFEAERLLATVGAEVQGGEATTEKGAAVLRQVIGEYGLDPESYLPKNGSGLGHENRITAHAMTDLLRALYLDPRVGPEMLQSLSVGGIDGTTRNRFRGTLVARRVRAKTGTLNGKSCLSGLVGDGEDVMAFSIMVEGFKSQGTLGAVRGAQVAAVETMMRYVQERTGGRVDLPHGFDLSPAGTDYETGGETEMEEGTPEMLVSANGPTDRAGAGAEKGDRAAADKGERAEKAERADDATPSASRSALPAVEPAASAVARLDPGARGEDLTKDADTVPSQPTSARVGFAGLGSYSGGDAAPGLGVFADWGTAGTGSGLELGLYGTGFHSFEGPGMGATDWTRFVAALGPRYQLPERRLAGGTLLIDMRAQIAAGLFWVRGRNYTMNQSSQTAAVGFGAGARGTWQRPGLSPWLGLDAIGFLGKHAIDVVGAPDSKDIPAYDLLLSIGASYRIW